MAKALTGILLDVSGSMRRNVGGGIDEEGGPWARSIFEVIDNLIKHDVSPDNSVFASAFGAKGNGEILDILTSLQSAKENQSATHDQVDEIFCELQEAGARNIREWASIEVVQGALTRYKARLFLEKAGSDKTFPKKFVQECLPKQCRDFQKVEDEERWFGIGGYLNSALKKADRLYARMGSAVKQASKEDIEESLRKAEPYLVDSRPSIFTLKPCIYNVKKASDILHGYIDGGELSKERSRELLKTVEPYIYGGTPMYQAITSATECFEKNESKFSTHKKLLFVLSDGYPSDGNNDDKVRISRAVTRLSNAGVTVVSCCVTESTDIEPKRLYSQERSDWDPGAKFLFSLSSILTTQSIPRNIFVNRHWSIEVINNETRLFLHVNHPNHLREACNLARDVVCSQEALSDLLADVDLDVYINQSVSDYEAQQK